MIEPSSKIRISDVTTLLARAVVGIVFIAHGLPKAIDLQSTSAGFDALGIPFPQLGALLAVGIEVGAGIALIVGFALPIAGVLLALMMGGAYFFAHVGDPLVGGFELLLILGVSALALGFSGGRYSVDSVMPWNRGHAQKRAPAHVA